jgi:hypothetical protein
MPSRDSSLALLTLRCARVPRLPWKGSTLSGLSSSDRPSSVLSSPNQPGRPASLLRERSKKRRRGRRPSSRGRRAAVRRRLLKSTQERSASPHAAGGDVGQNRDRSSTGDQAYR